MKSIFISVEADIPGFLDQTHQDQTIEDVDDEDLVVTAELDQLVDIPIAVDQGK